MYCFNYDDEMRDATMTKTTHKVEDLHEKFATYMSSVISELTLGQGVFTEFGNEPELHVTIINLSST